jgi:hypothetical protein
MNAVIDKDFWVTINQSIQSIYEFASYTDNEKFRRLAGDTWFYCSLASLNRAVKVAQSGCQELAERESHAEMGAGHKGVGGNEAVDRHAKEGAEGRISRGEQLPPILQRTLPLSLSAVKRQFTKRLRADNERTLSRSPRYQKLIKIDATIPSSKFRKLTESYNRR